MSNIIDTLFAILLKNTIIVYKLFLFISLHIYVRFILKYKLHRKKHRKLINAFYVVSLYYVVPLY